MHLEGIFASRGNEYFQASREIMFAIQHIKNFRSDLRFVSPCIIIQFKQITNQMQQISSLLSWRLSTAQHVSGAFPPIIRSSMTAVAASGFIFVSWW
jgi:hypothetical protein